MNRKIKEIIDFYTKNNFVFDNVPDDFADVLYDLINNVKVEYIPKEIYHFAGCCYLIYKNNEEAAKYYLLSIKENSIYSNLSANNFILMCNKNDNDFQLVKNYLIYSEQLHLEEREIVKNNCFKLIEKGNSNSMVLLGMLYEEELDVDLAEKYYLMSIQQNNNPLAIFIIASLYRINGNIDLAEKYYLESVEQNNSISMYELGTLYLRKENRELAKKYYLQAVEHNNINATVNLGLLYEIEGNKKFYLIATEAKCSEAMYNLGCLYREEKNTELEQQYLEKAINNNFLKAAYPLACVYEKQKNMELAKKYYEIALDNDPADDNIFYRLGRIFEKERDLENTKKNYKLAVKNSETYKKMYATSYIRCCNVEPNLIIYNLIKDNIKIKELEKKLAELNSDENNL